VTPELGPPLGPALAPALVLAALGLLPLAFMTLTAFVKISTVLHIARSALGVPEVPSSAVVFALSTALTLVVMAPVGERISARALPLAEGAAAGRPADVAALARAVREPLGEFLRANASPAELDRFLALRRRAHPTAAAEVTAEDLSVVVPAFLVTELVEAFLLGFALLLPFLAVDLVVATLLAALGLPGLPAASVALPVKLALFLAADGWGRLAETLVGGYQAP